MSTKVTSRVMVFNHAGLILLIKRSPHDEKPNLWDLPGGKIEPEDFNHHKPKKECARRELEEETGLNIKKCRLKPTGKYFHPMKNKLFCLFRTKLNGTPAINLSEEHTKAAWFDPKKLPPNMNPSTLKLIENSEVPFKLVA